MAQILKSQSAESRANVRPSASSDAAANGIESAEAVVAGQVISAVDAGESGPAPLRTDDSHRAARDVVGLAGFNLDDFADQGRHQIEQARQHIREMIRQAETEAEQIKAKAKTDGHAEGTAKAAVDFNQRVQDTAAKQSESAIAALKASVNQIRNSHQAWMNEYAKTLSQMIVAGCDRVLRKQLEDEPEIILKWAEEALLSARSSTELTLAVHPETLATLANGFDGILSRPELPEQTMLVPDETVKPTEVVVRQVGGEIQAGLEAQLARLTEMLP